MMSDRKMLSCRKKWSDFTGFLHRNTKNVMKIGLAVLIVGLFIVTAAALNPTGQRSSYAADKTAHGEGRKVPFGISGVIRGLMDSPSHGTRVKRLGTSAETVLVGQRVQTVGSSIPVFDVHGAMKTRMADFELHSASLSEEAGIMSDYDYENLCQIVEAEAGTEDIKGRILVANVIMNRVRNEEFPDTVSDVIYHYENGVAQFSPVEDGRIDDVTVSADTRKAVFKVLEGVDYSQGALFFIQKSAADLNCIHWFEKNLKFLFKYGVHEFYTYP